MLMGIFVNASIGVLGVVGNFNLTVPSGGFVLLQFHSLNPAVSFIVQLQKNTCASPI